MRASLQELQRRARSAFCCTRMVRTVRIVDDQKSTDIDGRGASGDSRRYLPVPRESSSQR